MDSQQTPTYKLVLADGPVDSPDIADDEVELGFRFGESTALNPHIHVDNIRFAEYLAHAIAASPSDLLRHTQRIFFFYEKHDSEGLYSALLDLFIALGNMGVGLRKRLLKGSQDRLMPDHYGVLAQWLDQASPCPEKDIPLPSQSVLNMGITGVRELVKVFNAGTGEERDPLLEAREHIEYFQIEEARDLLESAVLEHPERKALHIELTNLYQATRDHAHLRAMREKLSQIMTELPECWLTLSEPEPRRGGKNQ